MIKFPIRFYCLLSGIIFMNTRYSQLQKKTETAELNDKKIAEIFSLAKTYTGNAFDSVKLTGKLPRSTEKGFRTIEDWTVGFYPGVLWYIYEYSKDTAVLQQARYATALLEANKNFALDHDIGFIMYCSYGNGYRLIQDTAYKNILVASAQTAIKRYNPVVKAIMSWNPEPKRDWKFPVIIDNMMNLELLVKATQFSGDSTYYKIATNHANTTMQHQYRSNYSCAHVADYDPVTGKFRKHDWNNGNSDTATAAWSRGQAWGLYGFSIMYKHTRNTRYLEQAKHIANYVLSHPNMPADMVPYWDYNAPKNDTMRDASAAAITAAGLLQLAEVTGNNGKQYFDTARKILVSLASPKYLNQDRKGYFLLKHATGNFLRKFEQDGGLIYADYYFLEALLKYKELKKVFG